MPDATQRTALPLPSFDEDEQNLSNQNFLSSLRRLITLHLSDDPSVRVTNSDQEAWIEAISNLSTHLLALFPLCGSTEWKRVEQRILYTYGSLDFLERVLSRVDGLFQGLSEFTCTLFARLLHVCFALEIWMLQDIEPSDEVPTPKALRDLTFSVSVGLLRYLGKSCSTPTPDSEQPTWKVLRNIVEECLEVVRDIICPPLPLAFPLTITLFKKPNLQELKGDGAVVQRVSDDIHMAMVVEQASHLPLLLNLLQGIIAKALRSPLLVEWVLHDLIRRLDYISRATFEYYLSPSCRLATSVRAGALVTLVSLISTPVHGWNGFPDYKYRLLRYRLLDAQRAGWDVLDTYLMESFQQPYHWCPSNQEVLEIVDLLKAEGIKKEVKLAGISFLSCCLDLLNQETRVSMQTSLNAVDFGPTGDSFLQQLQEKIAPVPIPIDVDAFKLPDSWNIRFRVLIERIIKPNTISWMDDDQGLPDQIFVQRAFDDITARFESPLSDGTSTARQALLALLDELTDLLASGENPLKGAHLTIAPVILPVITRILTGSEREATSGVRRMAFRTLERALRHHTIGIREQADLTLLNLLTMGIADSERSVRLSAGKVFALLTEAYARHDSKSSELLFGHLYGVIDREKTTVKETLVAIVGSLGKTSNPEVLSHVVCFLVAQLGRSNPVLRGLACMQILTITKHQKKASPYPLMIPYLDKIAPFIVSRVCSQPVLLLEYSRLISVAPKDFMTITLSRTLPPIIASCDLKVLQKIANDLSLKPSYLLLKHSHEILAHIFLLQDSSETDKALNFIVQVLKEARSDKRIDIDIQSVVKSCIVSLLAELVVILGHEDSSVSQCALPALEKVYHALVTPAQGLGSLLKMYMLGLISHINDMLQDVQGKKTSQAKQRILRSLGHLVVLIGPAATNVGPQIMATFQTMVTVPELSEATLESWYQFLNVLGPQEIGAYVGITSAAFVSSWSTFPVRGQALAQKSLNYVILDVGEQLGRNLDDVVDLSSIPMLQEANDRLQSLRVTWTPKQRLRKILELALTDNLVMAVQCLRELKAFMLREQALLVDLASGDMFDSLVNQILSVLFSAACRDGEGADKLRLLAFECIGILGAVDPDRCEIVVTDTRMILLKNFTDPGESLLFAMHLIQDLLVGAYRSTSDIKYQTHLAYSIQELLKFCQFTPALVGLGHHSIPLKVRQRWNSLPKHVLETVAPLLEARFTLEERTVPDVQHPIYPHQSTYREWMQKWTSFLISRVCGETAQTIFGVFRLAVRNKDVVVAHHLLPHMVLNILIAGDDDDTQKIRSEMLAVLGDQVDTDSDSMSDKKLLSAQAVFMLLDHLNKWVRKVRQEITLKKTESKRVRPYPESQELEDQLLRVDSILASIDQNLMAKAALQCKAYARSLMNFEQQIASLKERSARSSELVSHYEHLHEIYAHLDEPDGMEGVSTLILSPSLEHQIREHESTGRWTSAQSCWEVRLQQSPDNVDFHLGLLRCLRNLGHYDTLRTHVRGALIRHPEWQATLAGFQIEGAWMVGAWDDVQHLVDLDIGNDAPMVTARLLLAIRTRNVSTIQESLSAARSVLGASIASSGFSAYRRFYEATLGLHMTHELELIYNTMINAPAPGTRGREQLGSLVRILSARLDATLPTFRTREPILSMRRAAFALCSGPSSAYTGEIGRSWLTSAKIARKAGQWQIAYSATLQAQQNAAPFSFMESAKLLKACGEPLRALQELENSMKHHGLVEENPQILDLTVEQDEETKAVKAKAQVLRARWMNESERFEIQQVFKTFLKATELLPGWESCHFYIGQYQDECFKKLPPADLETRGLKMNLYTVRSFAKAIKLGSKYVYQTIPRLLTIWLDLGEVHSVHTATPNANNAQNDFKRLNDVVAKAIKEAPVYKWFTAFPQIVSRVGHGNEDVYKHLSRLITKVIEEYPKQALWLFTSVIKSKNPNRALRGKDILDQLQNNPASAGTGLRTLIQQSVDMTNELLALCDYHVDDRKKTLSMSRSFPRLYNLGRSDLIIPLRESLTVSLPPMSSSQAQHQPFPLNVPTFEEIFDEIEIMHSLAKPRKITIKGSNGQIYMFLGKPKDDLRKDARLMDFNTIINKLLKANSESRRRQLHIRTYGVVTLNEECGFIQWVPNTTPIRPILVKLYDVRSIRSWTPEMADVFKKIKAMTDKNGAELYRTEILPIYPPVFHEWFIETFPEPSAWLASRLAYGRTAAVMSMVGFILGLGDRHLENILLDTNTGAVVHVDFNCLFEKGKSLETPERVAFRLTPNIIDALGVTGVEGVFRIACEVTMQILRDNKDPLMSVLDAFIHDPLVEWEDEKRKLERDRKNQVRSSVDLRGLAKNALNPIERKLKGIYSTSREKTAHVKEVSTSNLVQMLIQESTDLANLSRMYPGWAPWH